MMEFHISREARERYQFSDTLFSFNGNVVFADMPGCRTFAYRMNQVRDTANNPDRAIHAGALFAMGLIDEASHVVMARYREQFDPDVMSDALSWFGSQNSPEALDKLLRDLRGAFSRLQRDARKPDAPRVAGGVDGRNLSSGSGSRRAPAAVDSESQRGIPAL